MGRWGNTTYESDSTQDHFAVYVPNYLLREISFHSSPERVKQNTSWIVDVITVIELMLVLNNHEPVLSSYLMYEEQALQRWREVFFNVWDAEWDDVTDKELPLGNHTYRQAHRHVAVKWFDHLDELARGWSSHDMDWDPSKFAPEEKLPYFSTQHYSGLLLGNLVERLGYSMMYPRNRTVK